MSDNEENLLLSYLRATAEQLDIASEDVDIALDEVLETFEAAANCMESLEGSLNNPDEFDRMSLLEVTIRLRSMLRTSVVSLQFQDRLMQRLALASRELRQLVAEHTIEEVPWGEEDLKVPKSVSSLYDQRQMVRIIKAAGGDDVFQETGPPPNDEDDITLF